MIIQFKRAYDPASPTDGFRILADRLWPRGIKKEVLALDLWAKDIAPSTELRQSYHTNNHYEMFKKKYTNELLNNPALNDFIAILSKHSVITLLTASKVIELSALPILKEVIEERLATA